ncbi:MAG: prolipoprotein diacylglyceryl transferase [Planctomycetes bacterium]|nr:prolipoprotein diacylglyceryl transferase [Planctomycetota bacterium]
MHPILFEIPGLNLPLRSFGVMLAAGFLLGSWVFTKLAERHGDDPEHDPARYSAITMWILIGVVVGARLHYVIVQILRGDEDEHFLQNPLEMLKVWHGGLSMYGGMFGAIFFGMWKAKKEKVRALHALDLGLIAGMLGQAVGRVGCYLVGDDYGSVVPERFRDLPWPITLRVPDPLPDGSLFGVQNAGQVLWATENWMTIKALIVAAIGYWMLKHRKFSGQVTFVILIAYGVLRFAVECFRGDEIRGVWFDGAVSTSQIVSVAAVLFGATMLALWRARRDELPDARKRPAPSKTPPPTAKPGQVA